MLTEAQTSALDWLAARGGDGSIQSGERVLARGEFAPHLWTTWRALIAAGRVEEYREGKARRLRISTARSQR